MAHERFLGDLWVSTRCVMLEVLDSDQKPITANGSSGYTYASGFITNGIWDKVQGNYEPESGMIYLYTCWHVVVGHDPRDHSTPANYTQPRFLSVHGIGLGGPNSLSGRKSFIVPLYDDSGKPNWEQQTEQKQHPDFNSIGIRVPKGLDAVRLPISLDQSRLERYAIDPKYSDDRFFELGEDVFVCGFPYGFSSLGTSALLPVFLKRSIAAPISSDHRVALLDAGCAPVMSGGPVFSRLGKHWRLVGMYSGSTFTNPTLINDAEKKATALGTVMSFAVIKQSIGKAFKEFE